MASRTQNIDRMADRFNTPPEEGDHVKECPCHEDHPADGLTAECICVELVRESWGQYRERKEGRNA